MEHIQKQKATCEEVDQEGEEERDEKEDTEKIKEQGGPSCKLFWSDLKGEEEKYSKTEESDWKDHR